jgi:hypothetical protein
MIPRDYITEWRTQAPWVADRQVEQDLIIGRALVELFSHRTIANALAFRGGAALYRLHFQPAARYSEDIDLVQTAPGGIGPALDAIHDVLDSWLGKPQWKQTEGRVMLSYRFNSEDLPPARLKLKLEINSREMFEEGAHVTRAIFEQNLAAKRSDEVFRADLTPLLASGQTWSFDEAFDLVWRELVAKLPGEPWKGR